VLSGQLEKHSLTVYLQLITEILNMPVMNISLWDYNVPEFFYKLKETFFADVFDKFIFTDGYFYVVVEQCV